MSSNTVDCRTLRRATTLRLTFDAAGPNPMTDAPMSPSTAIDERSNDRLDSWKEIAAYMRRDVKTVQRWEKREGMPVHRHVHERMGSVYAFRNELDVWAQNRRLSHPDAPP